MLYSCGTANSPPYADIGCIVSAGVAVYVYCIVSNSKHYPTSLTFFIDGEADGSYSTSPTSTDDTSFNYNVLVYSNDALESGDHTIEIQNGGHSVQDSVILLDYIVYS